MLFNFCHSQNQLIAAVEIHRYAISVYYHKRAMKLSAEAFAHAFQQEMAKKGISINMHEWQNHAQDEHKKVFHPVSSHIHKLLHFHFSFKKAEVDYPIVDAFMAFLAEYQEKTNVTLRMKYENIQQWRPSVITAKLARGFVKFLGIDIPAPKNFSNYQLLSNKNFNKFKEEISLAYSTNENVTSTEVVNLYSGNIKNNRTLLDNGLTHERLINATCFEINNLAPPVKSQPEAQPQTDVASSLASIAPIVLTVAAGMGTVYYASRFFCPPAKRRNVNQLEGIPQAHETTPIPRLT